MTIAADQHAMPRPDAGWDAQAACRPARTRSGHLLAMTRAQIVVACRTCTVIEDCFLDAYYAGDRTTYRAAMTPEQRDHQLLAWGIQPPGTPDPAIRIVRNGTNGRRLPIDLDAVARMREGGQSWRQIGRTLGCNPDDLSRRWRESGRPLTRAKGSARDLSADVDPAALVNLVRAGWNVTQMAVALGVARATVERHIVRAREAGLL